MFNLIIVTVIESRQQLPIVIIKNYLLFSLKCSIISHKIFIECNKSAQSFDWFHSFSHTNQTSELDRLVGAIYCLPYLPIIMNDPSQQQGESTIMIKSHIATTTALLMVVEMVLIGDSCVCTLYTSFWGVDSHKSTKDLVSRHVTHRLVFTHSTLHTILTRI